MTNKSTVLNKYLIKKYKDFNQALLITFIFDNNYDDMVKEKTRIEEFISELDIMLSNPSDKDLMLNLVDENELNKNSLLIASPEIIPKFHIHNLVSLSELINTYDGLLELHREHLN